METTVAGLVKGLRTRIETAQEGKRVLVGLCGVPGSGKSQLASHVTAELNAVMAKEVAVVVGMDGWHLTRAQLEAMPNAKLARDKRGAAWTFDAKAFADFVTLLHSSAPNATLRAPSFSHSLKDPVEDSVAILPHHHLVILEGLYANINEGEWARAARLYDERWVILCQEDIARARLIVRHVATGVGKDEEEAAWRADNNDMPNGRYLLEHVQEPAIRIQTLDDSQWRGGG